jgi:WXG100 family type VII secretion target
VSEYRINYSQVIRQANTIDGLAGDLGRQIQRLNNILSSLNSGWQGPASSAFRSQLSRLINDMNSTRSSMSSVSSTISNVAYTIQKEDERLAELARLLAAQQIGVAAVQDISQKSNSGLGSSSSGTTNSNNTKKNN